MKAIKMETDPELILYRLASAGDFDAVYELYMDETSNPFLSYDQMGKEEFKIIYNEMLAAKDLFVAELQNEIIGTFRLIRKTHRLSDTVYIGGFVVKSSQKGKGFGKRILDNIKGDALANGIKRIELTVSIDNEAAISLYKKLGFEKEGYIRKSYKLQSTGEYYDEYLMALIL